jgi:dihydroxyacetone kinase
MPISAPTSALSAQDEEPREATSEIKPGDFRSTAIIVLSKLTHHSEELRELDASIGDGDLGVTISEGVKSAVQSIKSLPADADVSEVLRAIGVGFAAGNPSTFAALVGGGIASASLTMKDQAELGQAEWLKIIKATLDSVQRRGKATTGDKTIVDPLSSMVQYLERSIPDATITGLLEVVRSTVEQSAQWRSLQGRANWAGDRSIGVPDPGSVAILRFIEGVNDYLA